MKKYVITISRQFASLGRSIAQKMAEELEIEFYDRDIVEATAKRMELPVSRISEAEEIGSGKFFKRMYPLGMGVANMQEEIFDIQTNIVQDFAAKGSCIVVGRCGNYILNEHPNALHIYIYASAKHRLDNCINVLQMQPKIAKKMIKDVDKARYQYHKSYDKTGNSIYDGYDLIVDSSRFGVDGTAEMLVNIIKAKLM